MAEPAGIRAALVRLGFTMDAAFFITDEQGMDSLDEFRFLTDEEVEDLCKVVRKPGGTIANPNAGQAGQPDEIPNPGGIPVSLKACNNLKMMCYLLRFRHRTSRTTMPVDITVQSVRRLREYKEWEESHEDPEDPELIFKDWPRTIETIREYLRTCLGTTKIPLAYVIREKEEVPNQDPPGGYNTIFDELIERAPIRQINGEYNDIYLADRSKVWEKIANMTREYTCWSYYVRPAQRTRDGRLAFQGLEDHYLGVNNVDNNMAAKAERKMRTVTYTGEARRWNFEQDKYVRTHVDQFHILEGLTKHGYKGIDERSRVRLLLDGIKTHALDHIKAQILSSQELRNSFDKCVNLYQDFISQASSANTKDISIAAIQTRPNTPKKIPQEGNFDNIEPDMSIEDWYYNMNCAKEGFVRQT